ncbi:N-acetylmuramoyl-L-alanine amidase [Dyella nitratireducens]|uniref:N-acetylmuramoyl-L-alanine amidase n=1 Tax=Dyella nitratireducens TaxID=1849580 RepID=A0ABQ1FNV4_9GAMM|nr:N-acetylmuramoyl-L-alanine amidase [Dyella nitratireducens]GGA23241.1 N-acetylmuramoyl-L-alanine amidase [Dyella nitratireducens]GLQ43995.1 N-acetylmuramoyl-L-alanine amidase [Dyella nitratireducens]
MYAIDYNGYRSGKSFNQRARFLVFHYTAANFNSSVRTLTGSDVSAHYLVPDPSDESYIHEGFKDIRIFNLVDEKERAWHAGVSYWRGRDNLNDTSIGIEIVNQAYDKDGDIVFLPYHAKQIKAVEQLALNILQRYPDISPTHVIGHSDIAPGRKSDPGPLFPWKALHQAGVGAWYEETTHVKYLRAYAQKMPADDEVFNMLSKYGYDIRNATNPAGKRALIRAFQLHFRPARHDGELDVETVAILSALVERYY